MPELPEVQTMATDLDKLTRGKKIKDVWYNSPKQISVMVSGSIKYKGKIRDRLNLATSKENEKIFRESLIGSEIVKVGRRAKNVLIYLRGHKLLLVHPKMTGHLLFGKWKMDKDSPIGIEPEHIKEKVNSYIRFLIFFTDGWMVGFSDARRFGKILLGDEEAIMMSRDLRSLGPEPLLMDFNLEVFSKIIKKSKGRIKQFLLDQNKIAGIGNIYADEILWRVKINPLRKLETLKDADIKNLFRAIKEILTEAVRRRGTSKTDYRDAYGKKGSYIERLKVYGRAGKPCLRCKTKIERIFIGARSAAYCPKCQSGISE